MSHRATVVFLLAAFVAALISQALGGADDDHVRERMPYVVTYHHNGD